METMKNFGLTINPKIIIPGHGRISQGDIIDKYISYLDYVLELSNSLKKEDVRIEEYVKKINIPSRYSIDYENKDLMEGFHKWNVLNSYKQIE